jgi:hypothetical protein
LRALGGQSDGVALRTQSAAMGQDVYRAPSVFSFYPPNYPLPETSLVSPVSAIYTGTTAFARANFVHTLLYNSNGVGILPDPTVAGAIGTRVDISPLAMLADDPAKLVDKLDLMMLHKSMPAAMRNIIIQAINSIPESDPLARARMAVYLLATSPQYQVER